MDRRGILIVDDHPAIRTTVRSLLDAHKLCVCGEAEDGKAAVEKAKELQPDIILLDILMPKMNGFEAAQEIRRMLPLTKIVFFTVVESAGFEERGKLWSHGFVSKSAAATQLVPTLKTLLEEPPNEPMDETQLNRFTYPWQRVVMDVFAAPRDTLPAKINLAERTIAGRLTDSDEPDQDERIALRESLRALRQLIWETKPADAQKAQDDEKHVA
jgi:DNA-binding NarL/FixJ family response regulator